MTQQRTRAPRERESTSNETVVNIRRVAKTVAGGRRFTFNALVVVGDGGGRVGFGQGRANEVPEAIRKGAADARKNMVEVPLNGSTIPQQMTSRYCGARVLLKPAAPGAGVRAGAAVRAVVEAAGIRDIMTKSLGSSNHVNVVRATMKALQAMRPVDPRWTQAARVEKTRKAESKIEGAPPEKSGETARAEVQEPEVSIVETDEGQEGD